MPFKVIVPRNRNASWRSVRAVTMSSDTLWHFEGIFLENFFSLTHYITAHSGSDVERQVRNAMRRSATELIVVLGGSDLDQWQDYRSNGRTFCGRQRVVQQELRRMTGYLEGTLPSPEASRSSASHSIFANLDFGLAFGCIHDGG